ncbi:MAG: cupredoxin domain-containing protein [Actinomycetota bacterium]|nr:cupredoxin domain-containing protein [Actinomycetota bacterium]
MKKLAMFVVSGALALAMTPAHAANVSVAAAGLTFIPPVFQAHGGATVTFTNMDVTLFPHTLTSDAPICGTGVVCNTGTVSPGGHASFVLKAGLASGQYQFHCNFHPNMKALLVV